jgi:hypothetical protein
VCWYQRQCGFPELSLRVSHVGLYVGDGDLVHSTPSALRTGVRTEPVADVTRRRKVTIVRFPALVAELSHDASSIVRVAREMSGSYNYRAVLALARDSFARLQSRGLRTPANAMSGNGISAPRDDTFLCGDFVFGVFDRVLRAKNPLGVSVMRSPARVPAEFFTDPRLVDVSVPVRRRAASRPAPPA